MKYSIYSINEWQNYYLEFVNGLENISVIIEFWDRALQEHHDVILGFYNIGKVVF